MPNFSSIGIETYYPPWKFNTLKEYIKKEFEYLDKIKMFPYYLEEEHNYILLIDVNIQQSSLIDT